INDKVKIPSSCSSIDIMHLVGFRAMANNINKLACLTLPREPEDPEHIISTAIDYQEWDAVDNDSDPAVITEYK
ncbi:5316_t:CDS:2, partial [Dentiscutata heterogama]